MHSAGWDRARVELYSAHVAAASAPGLWVMANLLALPVTVTWGTHSFFVLQAFTRWT
jgi:hypothetical protein